MKVATYLDKCMAVFPLKLCTHIAKLHMKTVHLFVRQVGRLQRLGVSNSWTGIWEWNDAMEIEWNGECKQL